MGIPQGGGNLRVSNVNKLVLVSSSLERALGKPSVFIALIVKVACIKIYSYNFLLIFSRRGRQRRGRIKEFQIVFSAWNKETGSPDQHSKRGKVNSYPDPHGKWWQIQNGFQACYARKFFALQRRFGRFCHTEDRKQMVSNRLNQSFKHL